MTFSFLFLLISLPFYFCDLSLLLIGCLFAAFLLAVCYLSCFPVFAQSDFCYSLTIKPNKERLVLSNSVEHFSFFYGVLRNLCIIISYLSPVSLYLLKSSCSNFSHLCTHTFPFSSDSY